MIVGSIWLLQALGNDAISDFLQLKVTALECLPKCRHFNFRKQTPPRITSPCPMPPSLPPAPLDSLPHSRRRTAFLGPEPETSRKDQAPCSHGPAYRPQARSHESNGGAHAPRLGNDGQELPPRGLRGGEFVFRNHATPMVAAPASTLCPPRRRSPSCAAGTVHSCALCVRPRLTWSTTSCRPFLPPLLHRLRHPPQPQSQSALAFPAPSLVAARLRPRSLPTLQAWKACLRLSCAGTPATSLPSAWAPSCSRAGPCWRRCVTCRTAPAPSCALEQGRCSVSSAPTGCLRSSADPATPLPWTCPFRPRPEPALPPLHLLRLSALAPWRARLAPRRGRSSTHSKAATRTGARLCPQSTQASTRTRGVGPLPAHWAAHPPPQPPAFQASRSWTPPLAGSP